MEQWSTFEKILTGAVPALGITLFVLWKVWGRYTFQSDREQARSDANTERLLKALNDSTTVLASIATVLDKFADANTKATEKLAEATAKVADVLLKLADRTRGP